MEPTIPYWKLNGRKRSASSARKSRGSSSSSTTVKIPKKTLTVSCDEEFRLILDQALQDVKTAGSLPATIEENKRNFRGDYGLYFYVIM